MTSEQSGARRARQASATTETSGTFRWLALLFAAATSVACSSPRSDGFAKKPAETLDPRAPGASVVCGVTGGDGQAPEIETYMLDTMNHKLGYYPEFAAAVGMDLVSDCDGARRFAREYAQYSAEYPGFDDDEPFVERPDNDDPPPEASSPSTDVPKILTAPLATNNPVVRITITFPANAHSSWGPLLGEPVSCSGTFLNKNWILTAAHCINLAAIRSCMVAGQSVQACTPKWDQWAQWRITGTRGTASTPYTVHDQLARGYGHEKWLGRNRPTNPELCANQDGGCYDAELGADHDLGLLYLRTEDDHQLTPALEDNGAMRLSTVTPPNLSWPMHFYGWGEDRLGESALRRGTYNPAYLRFDLTRQVVEATILDISAPVVCGGDSGGPLVRSGMVLDANLERKTNVEAIVGVASASTAGGGNCLGAVNHSYFFARIDTKDNQEFIKRILKRRHPYKRMPCTKRALVGGSTPEVEECWGKPCAADVDCKDDSKFCWQSWQVISRQRSACDACRTVTATSTTCDCIVGQCTPKR
jgi:hypothetical protein